MENIKLLTIQAFLAAARYGDIITVRDFVEQKIPIDAVDEYGESALMKACRHGHEDIVYLLIENGADVNKINSKGESSLDLTKVNAVACYSCCYESQWDRIYFYLKKHGGLSGKK